MKIQKCSVCTLKKDEQHFKRKDKIYKTCNKCSEYCMSRRKKVKTNSTTSVGTTDTTTCDVLSKIFCYGQSLPVELQHKYQHIKQLENDLLNEIYVIVRQDME